MAYLSLAQLGPVLGAVPFSPEALLAGLKEDPFLREECAKNVGLFRFCSLEEHVLRVLGQFEWYFPRNQFPAGMSREFFRLFLALHDIGKPRALQEGDKSRQHRYTAEVLKSRLPQWGYASQQVRLGVSLADGDPIGTYLKGGELARSVREMAAMARGAGCAPADFFDLLTIYYQVDAGSYTTDAGGNGFLDHLFIFDRPHRKISFSAEISPRFQELATAVRGLEVSG